MNQKTVKLIKKYASLKGVSEKQIKLEWMNLNKSERDIKRQEYLSNLVKK